MILFVVEWLVFNAPSFFCGMHLKGVCNSLMFTHVSTVMLFNAPSRSTVFARRDTSVVDGSVNSNQPATFFNGGTLEFARHFGNILRDESGLLFFFF